MTEAGLREPRRFVARSFAALFGLGGGVVLLTLPLPHAVDRLVLGMAIPACLALLAALLLVVRGARLPLRLFWALPPFGSVLVAVASYSAGRELRVTYAAFFFWAVAAAFYFFPRRVAVPNVPLVALLFAVELGVAHEPLGLARYFVPMAALSVSAVMIDRLNAERERLQGELERVVETLEGQARTDAVTGLPNRREFERQLARELARAERSGRPLAVLMIDLDHFKELNDTLGHAAGDRFLRAASRAWGARLREVDLLARYGGDEFAAILPECGPAHAAALSERLRAAVPQGRTCSIGAASWREDDSGETLLGRADQALLRAKRGGRNEVRIATGELAAPVG